MFLKSLLPRFKQHLKLCSFLNFTNIYWNKEKNTLDYRHHLSIFQTVSFYGIRIIVYSFGLFLALNSLHGSWKTALNLSDLVVSAVISYTYGIMCFLNFTIYTDEKNVFRFLQCLVYAEENYFGQTRNNGKCKISLD